MFKPWRYRYSASGGMRLQTSAAQPDSLMSQLRGSNTLDHTQVWQTVETPPMISTLCFWCCSELPPCVSGWRVIERSRVRRFRALRRFLSATQSQARIELSPRHSGAERRRSMQVRRMRECPCESERTLGIRIAGFGRVSQMRAMSTSARSSLALDIGRGFRGRIVRVVRPILVA